MSFFSGALGLDLGLEKAGLQPICYNEIDKCFCQTIALNRPKVPLLDADIRELTPKQLLREYGLKKGELFAVVGDRPVRPLARPGIEGAYRMRGEMSFFIL